LKIKAAWSGEIVLVFSLWHPGQMNVGKTPRTLGLNLV